MRLTKYQKQLLGRLASGDKLYTDTRQLTGRVHRDDLNHTDSARVPFKTIETLMRGGLIKHGHVFHKRGEYSRHWYVITGDGLREAE